MMLVLASASPRRRDLLTQAGLRFEVVPAHIDESRHAGESPGNYVERLALEKARAIRNLRPEAVILGADTTVVCEDEVLNKPVDLREAERMLRGLSGRSHQVHTGVAVVTPATERSHVETATVFFAPIPEDDLQHYLSTGEGLDKAGGYGIQGYAARWIPRVEGDFYNVVGLPIAATIRLLREAKALRNLFPECKEISL